MADERTPLAEREEEEITPIQGETPVEETPVVDEKAEREKRMEEEARASGWVPLTEWRGDAEDHVSAREFLRVSRIVSPLKRKLDEAERRNGEFVKKFGDITKQIESEAKAKYEAELNRLNSIKKDAFERADFTAFEAANEEAARIKERIATSVPESVDAQAQNVVFRDWVNSNSWYNNPELQREADDKGREIAIRITGGTRDMTPFEYQYMLSEVAKEFGAKAKPAAPPPVQPARAPAPQGRSKTRTFNSLNADEKEAFRRFQRMGIYKDSGDIEKDALSYIRDLDSADTAYTIRGR